MLVATILSVCSLLLGTPFIVRRGSRPNSIAFVLSVLVTIPLVVLFLMRRAGASTLLQYNAGDEELMRWFDLWGGLWPFFVLGLLAAGLVSIGLVIVLLTKASGEGERKLLVLKLTHCVSVMAQAFFVLWIVVMNFPSV